MFLNTVPATWLWRSTSSLPTGIEQTAVRWLDLLLPRVFFVFSLICAGWGWQAGFSDPSGVPHLLLASSSGAAAFIYLQLILSCAASSAFKCWVVIGYLLVLNERSEHLGSPFLWSPFVFASSLSCHAQPRFLDPARSRLGYICKFRLYFESTFLEKDISGRGLHCGFSVLSESSLFSVAITLS